MWEDDKKCIEGYLKGHQKEYSQITSWINNVVKNDYWGLKTYWDDIIQDVRMKLYLNLKQNRFGFNSSLKTYVSRIARYTCIDYLRKKNCAMKVDLNLTQVWQGENTLTALLQGEQLLIFEQIFQELQKECQKILQMVFIERLAYKKISSQLGIAEGTVKSRVSRCINKAIQLRKKFSE